MKKRAGSHYETLPITHLLLPGHRDLEALLRRDQVVEILGVLININLHPIHCAAELVVFLTVVRRDG